MKDEAQCIFSPLRIGWHKMSNKILLNYLCSTPETALTTVRMMDDHKIQCFGRRSTFGIFVLFWLTNGATSKPHTRMTDFNVV